jgi:hypothetical protein
MKFLPVIALFALWGCAANKPAAEQANAGGDSSNHKIIDIVVRWDNLKNGTNEDENFDITENPDALIFDCDGTKCPIGQRWAIDKQLWEELGEILNKVSNEKVTNETETE